MNKPEVGQTIYSLNIGNAARWTEQKLTPVVVTKVGRKYFYISDPDKTDDVQLFEKVHLSNWVQATDYSECFRLYETVQAYSDEKERKEIIKIIRKSFDLYKKQKFTLEQLRAIREIIEGDSEGE